MRHGAGQAVFVDGEDVDGHIAEQVVEIQITEIYIVGIEVTEIFSAADVHAVRLIELAVLHAVIAEQEAILHGLERKIDAPVFAIDGEFGVIVEGGVRAEVLVHIVDQRLFHIGGVGIVVVQDELIQTEAGLSVYIVVKFQLEAVAVGRGVAGDGGQAGVALGADGDAVKGRIADLDVALVIFLRRGVGRHIVPVGLVHADIDLEHAARIEQRRLIRHGNAGLPCRCRDWTGKRDCAQAQADGGRHACSDDSRADDRQRDHARTDDNAHRERPEQEHDLDRLLDGRAEADDGQRAHHAERQDHVARDGHNDQRGDKGQAHQRQREAAGIQHAGQRFLVDDEDEQADHQRDGQADEGIKDGKLGNVLQKAGFEDVVECHGSSSCFLTEPTACAVFGKRLLAKRARPRRCADPAA